MASLVTCLRAVATVLRALISAAALAVAFPKTFVAFCSALFSADGALPRTARRLLISGTSPSVHFAWACGDVTNPKTPMKAHQDHTAGFGEPVSCLSIDFLSDRSASMNKRSFG